MKNIHSSALLGSNCRIWGTAQIRENAVLGDNVTVGTGCYIGPGVEIGSNSKIQNLAQVFGPASLEDGVFVGPGVILTNDRFPRAVTDSMVPKAASDWTPCKIIVCQGASIGAGSICVGPISIGRWALIGAGSVVTRDVDPFSLCVGQPARQIGWVGPAGRRLVTDANASAFLICPETGATFKEDNGQLVEVHR